jgi:hypothetical protein
LRELATSLPDGSVAVTRVGADVWHVSPFPSANGPAALFRAHRIVRSRASK